MSVVKGKYNLKISLMAHILFIHSSSSVITYWAPTVPGIVLETKDFFGNKKKGYQT
jgi:hypothetical protein